MKEDLDIDVDVDVDPEIKVNVKPEVKPKPWGEAEPRLTSGGEAGEDGVKFQDRL